MELLENAYNLSGSVKAICVENHAEEDVEICIGQKLGTVHSMHIDKEVWLREELRGRSELEMDADENKTPSKTVNSVQESDYPTEERKRKFIWESFKIVENKI